MQQRASKQLLIAMILTLTWLLGCSPEPETPSQQATVKQDSPPITQFELGKKDTLRVLAMAHPEGPDSLPRSGENAQTELQLAARFAQQHGLKFEIIPVARRSELIPSLLNDQGDLIADNLTITEERKSQLQFTLPLVYVKEQLVSRKDEQIATRADLKGRRIAVHQSASHYQTLQHLAERVEIEIEAVAEEIHSASIISGVGDGRYDLAIADSHLIQSTMAYEENIKVAIGLGSIRSIAWATQPSAHKLHNALNEFLSQQQLRAEQQLHTDDLAAIKQRGVLRVISRNNAATYYLWQGELLGFEYELIKQFAKQHDLRIEVVIPPDREQLMDWLRQGKGDIIAASLSVTEQRRQERGISFTRHYNKVSEVLVGQKNEAPITDLQQLAGRSIAVRKSSAYWQTLQPLLETVPGLKIITVDEELETEQIIAKVADGEYDLTVADEHLLAIELTWRDDLQALYTLTQQQPHGWAIRSNNPELLNSLNTYLKKEYRGLNFNVTYNKYFKNNKRIRQHATQRSDQQSGLSPYDALAQQYAIQYGFDWRLIISQMYQESQFDPMAKSWVGALGLMQVMPRTGKELELTNLTDPEEGIHAGTKYLAWLMQRFEPELDVAERTWFALAAYNAGIGHVRDARTLARRKGWNPNEWFGNVEKAMLLLANKQYYKKARHGYVRGQEPVHYVQKIRERYLAYHDLSGE